MHRLAPTCFSLGAQAWTLTGLWTLPPWLRVASNRQPPASRPQDRSSALSGGPIQQPSLKAATVWSAGLLPNDNACLLSVLG